MIAARILANGLDRRIAAFLVALVAIAIVVRVDRENRALMRGGRA